MDNEIKTLFKLRDKAVENQDRKLFLSTQINELEYGSTVGYLEIKHLHSDILHIHKESDIEILVLVKETYSPPDKEPYSSFPVYYLTKTVKGWRIYKVK